MNHTRNKPAHTGYRRIAAAASILSLSLVLLASGQASDEGRTEYVMGTSCSIRLFGASASAYDRCFARLRQLDSRLSANDPKSELSRLNARAGQGPIAASADIRACLKKGLEYAALTEGAFDPTIGPVVKAWGIGTDAARVPSTNEIRAKLALVGWRGVRLDDAAGTVELAKPGMALDLGAIAKGYAADELAKLLKSMGVRRGIIDLGGNIFAYGAKEDGADWVVGIQDPDYKAPRGRIIGTIAVGPNATVVSSGDYERYFIDKKTGKYYHHILDARTGYPAATGLSATVVVSGSSIDADCLSTSLFILGYREGAALIAKSAGARAAFVGKDGKVRLTQGLAGALELDDPRFALAQ
jgi:FAD:protein FMN transferase